MKLSLGPFQGITDAPFRNVFKRHFGGIDKFYTPFFTGIQKDHAKNLQVEEIDPTCNDVETLTPQILSTDAEEILRFAKQCQQLGYKEINLNMGCPFPRVANKRRGCGLLPYPEMVEAMFERIFEGIDDMKFSVKCRLGYFDPKEIEAIIPIFNRFPLSELIIHPRIGKQLYKGEADVERFKALTPYINAPLVYNGDIFSVESFKRICNTVQPVNQFMLGRGLLANPFLAEEIKGTCVIGVSRHCEQDKTIQEANALDCFVVPPRNDATRQSGDYTVVPPRNDATQQSGDYTVRLPRNDEPANKTNRLHHYLINLYEDRLRHAGGSPKVLGRMKELWSYLMNSFEEPQDVWRKIKKINALKEYEEAVEKIFRDIEITIK